MKIVSAHVRPWVGERFVSVGKIVLNMMDKRKSNVECPDESIVQDGRLKFEARTQKVN